jgi:DNA mismatch repair protein MutS
MTRIRERPPAPPAAVPVSATLGTPMMRQYLAIKREYPDAIVFYRMGDFYEMFLDDAVTASSILRIALTTRDRGKEDAVPMCGVPYHACEGYIARMVAAGHKVAVCEQAEDPATAKGLVKREVVRVVTPGTAVESALLDEREHSYLAALFEDTGGVGLALVDVSTGDFRAGQFAGAGARDRALRMMGRFAPRELLLPEGAQSPPGAWRVSRAEGWRFDPEVARDALTGLLGVATLAGFGIDGKMLATGAAGAAASYLSDVHRRGLPHIRAIRQIDEGGSLVLDPAALRNLEVLRSSCDGAREGSLLALLDRTRTGAGARRLREMISAPLREAAAIEERLDLVQELVEDLPMRLDLAAGLEAVADIERLLARLAAGSGGPRDLGALSRTLSELPGLLEAMAGLESALGEGTAGRIDPLEELGSLLARALADDLPHALKDGGTFRTGYDAELDEARKLAAGGKGFIASLEARERGRTGIASLKVGYNRVFGYYLEVTNAHRHLVPADYVRKQTLVNAERFLTPELKEMEEKVLSAEERTAARERELFEVLRREVLLLSTALQEDAAALADLDAFLSLAETAHAHGYVRPVILADDPARRISIKGGRHPVIERLSPGGEAFVPNDAYLDSGSHRLQILTGPNMAGKSTFMRQVALIVLMAQAGSFVPAAEALVSPVDRIFTRVGASDLLARGLSTFMVEMVETSEILANAGPRSLVVLDEIGRGTSTFDGISIAWAVAEYLLDGPCRGAKTLFATHYHELTELALTAQGVRNLKVAVKEWGDRLVFLRRVQEGAADKSYGIAVARLAGLPSTVVERAREILGNLEATELDPSGRPVLAAHDARPREGQGGDPGPVRESAAITQAAPQMDLFSPRERMMREDLRALDLETLTPLDALNKLAELVRRYG